MPKTKGQGVVFGIFMSIFMAYGMEVYNVAIKMGYTLMPGGLSNMKNEVFLEALKEAAYMWVFFLYFLICLEINWDIRFHQKSFNPKRTIPFLSR